MKGYIIYNKTTGNINRFIYAYTKNDRLAYANVMEGLGYVWYDGDFFNEREKNVDISDDTFPLINKTTQSLTTDTTTITADSSSKATISSIAVGTIAFINIDGENPRTVGTPNGKIRFCTGVVGDHDIVFKNPAYLDTTVTITATAP